MAVSPPAPPTLLPFEDLGVRQVTVSYQIGANNGAIIEEVQIGYGTDSNAPQKYVTATGPTVINGLSSFTTYFFWVRARNSAGWSVLSARSNIKTGAGVWVRIDGTWHHALVYLRAGDKWRLVQPFVKRAGLWRRCG